MSTEKQYLESFNNGYLLEEYKPGLLSTVTKSLSPVNNYLKGFFEGMNQFKTERQQEQLLQLQQIRNQAKSIEKDLEL